MSSDLIIGVALWGIGFLSGFGLCIMLITSPDD